MTTIAVLVPYLLIAISYIAFCLKKDSKFNIIKNKTLKIEGNIKYIGDDEDWIKRFRKTDLHLNLNPDKARCQCLTSFIKSRDNRTSAHLQMTLGSDLPTVEVDTGGVCLLTTVPANLSTAKARISTEVTALSAAS